MASLVPTFPPLLDVLNGDADASTGLRAALPVKGQAQWTAFADAANWIIAQGGTLVTQGPSGGVDVGGSTTYRYYIWPRYQIAARLYCVSLGMRIATQANWHATGSITGVGSWKIEPSHYRRVSTFQFLVPVVSPTNTAGELTVVLNQTSGGASVYLEGLSIYEIPRATLERFGPAASPLTADPAYAPLRSSLQTGAPITEGNTATATLSVDGLLRVGLHEELAQSAGRRSCLFSDFRLATLVQAVGTTYTSVFFRDPAVLARGTYFGSSVRQIAIAAYGSGPTGSNVRFTADSGATATLVLPTSAGWITGVLNVDAEDPGTWSSSGGLRSDTRDRIAVQAQRVGAGTCSVLGICMGEAQI